MMNSLYPLLVTDILGTEGTASFCKQRRDSRRSRGTEPSVMASGFSLKMQAKRNQNSSEM